MTSARGAGMDVCVFALPLAPLDSTVHIIQVALTPVFLLSAIAGLLSVFSTRLARVADQVDKLAAAIEAGEDEKNSYLALRLAFLRQRSLVLDVAVVLGAVAGGATCGAALTLFISALSARVVASLLFGLFGFAILCTIGALICFVIEMLMASRGVRAIADRGREEAEG